MKRKVKFIFWGLIVIVCLSIVNLGYQAVSADQRIAEKTETDGKDNEKIASKPIDGNVDSAKKQQEIIENPLRIPILMYHYIRDYRIESDPLGSNLSVSPTFFELQIKTLVDNGYQTITMEQYLTNNFQGRVFMVTFDDGYQDAYIGFKILKKYSQKGIFYIISDRINQPGYLSDFQIKEISDSGMIIGGHTKSHPDLVNLAKNHPDSLLNELIESQQKIETILKKEVTDFCYPAGSYDNSVISALKNSGYQSAVITKRNLENFDRMSIPRIRMTNFSGEALLSIVNKYYE